MDWRKCHHAETLEKLIFHKWVEEHYYARHPENPQHDRIYFKTYALCEKSNGVCELMETSEIIFDKF
jgi:hypothetical protein